MTASPIVLLTALNLEYQAVRDNLVDLHVRHHEHGTRFEVGRLADGQRPVALGLVGKGNHTAAVLAERAIAEFAPAALIFVGVAGALRRKVELGDVVVASHVYAYHGGTSQDDGLKGRPRVWQLSHAAEQVAQSVARHQRPFSVHLGPIAAGEVVLDSAVSSEARWVREHYNDALAVEMEAAGVAQAAHLNSALPAVVVRGISDRADGTKEVTDRARWQPRAAANAASFAVALAAQLPAHPVAVRPTVNGKEPTSREAGGRTLNVARGHARVGVQAGHIHGDVRIGPEAGPPPDVADQLADLVARLESARGAGKLDEDTYAEATAELDVAGRNLRPEARGRMLLALKKVLGLVGDVAELGSRVALLVRSVKDAS